MDCVLGRFRVVVLLLIKMAVNKKKNPQNNHI